MTENGTIGVAWMSVWCVMGAVQVPAHASSVGPQHSDDALRVISISECNECSCESEPKSVVWIHWILAMCTEHRYVHCSQQCGPAFSTKQRCKLRWFQGDDRMHC